MRHTPEVHRRLLAAQESEITEHLLYLQLSRQQKNHHNRNVLASISAGELKHYHLLRKHTEMEVSPNKLKLWVYYIVTMLFGLTFGIKLMEKGERRAQEAYTKFVKVIPEIKTILHDEEEHEKKLIDLLEEERLQYVGSIVLGLNDALVELTGALAGFTLALGRTSLVAMVGLITGLAAALSMGASEFQSRRSESDPHPYLGAFYTGSVYFVTVLILILPYFIFNNIYLALVFTLFFAFLIILVFTYYVSVAKDLPFWKRFLEMIITSFGVAAITFGIGFLVQKFLGISV